MAQYEFIRLADQALKFQIADGETLEDSPITYINDAEVVATLYDPAGDPVPGLNELTMAYVTNSDGMYRGVIQCTGPESPSGEFDPPVSVGYRLEIVVHAPGSPNDANRTFIFPASVIDG